MKILRLMRNAAEPLHRAYDIQIGYRNVQLDPMAFSCAISRSVNRSMFPAIFGGRRRTKVFAFLKQHFGQNALELLTVSERRFPVRVRADLQQAIESLFGETNGVLRFRSVRRQSTFATRKACSGRRNRKAR
jgi:hypothetical protein